MRKLNYPANLLQAIHLNEKLGTDLDYEDFTADQKRGLEYYLSVLTPREQSIIEHYYKNHEARKVVALGFQITEQRVTQIINHALKKLTSDYWLRYAAQGFENRTAGLQLLIEKQEQEYCNKHCITDGAHLYYQPVENLHCSARVKHSMKNAGIKTVRELLILLQSNPTPYRIRNFGAISRQEVTEKLIKEHLLSSETMPLTLKCSMPMQDFTYFAFCKLNNSLPADFAGLFPA